jgi:hypothetical protein
MKLSDTEKKVLMLAMDVGATDGEIASAASKFVHSLRKRYRSGIELIKDIESGRALSQPQPTSTAAASSSNWQDIMRDAKRRGEERAQRQRQQWQEYVRRTQQRQTWQEEAEEWAKEQLNKTKVPYWKRFMGQL